MLVPITQARIVVGDTRKWEFLTTMVESENVCFIEEHVPYFACDWTLSRISFGRDHDVLAVGEVKEIKDKLEDY